MFTGIIQSIGIVQSIEKADKDCSLYINTSKGTLVAESLGESIAVNGVCLTVTKIDNHGFFVDVSHETLIKTTFSELKENATVNLEKALTLATPISGHLVTGHVDGTGKLVRKDADGQSNRYYFSLPHDLKSYVAKKGSITIDGISLTVNGVDDESSEFDVSIIPHTESVTNLGLLKKGDEVNLEIDVIARYVERSLSVKSSGAPLTLDDIRKSGL